MRTWLIDFCAKNGSRSQNFEVVKNLKKKCNPQDVKFYLGKLTNKIFPIGANVSLFAFLYCLMQWKQTQNYKINTALYGKIFYYLTYQDIV